MEASVSPQGQKHNLHSRIQKSSLFSSKDLFHAVRDGSLNDVEIALLQLKKSGGNVDWRNAFGLTPLHIASWRNHIPILRRILAAGADPDARDGESGWSSLHRALHFGHLAVASVLLQSGASIFLEDSKSRIPVDLISGPVSQNLGDVKNAVATEVFSWGSGANYQLGTGKDHIQKLPCIVESLHGAHIKSVSAAKFHSVAVSVHGELFTWGFGRGGRLGQPDFDIHSGQAAVITPIRVIAGLGSRRVKMIAAAKHHTVVATESGDVFTWGSNREGQLGYTSVDTQPIPRRVSSLKSKIVSVAAANKHTAVVSDTGEVFTWGCNKDGQLGYGTYSSGSSYTPRLVESLKGKLFTGIAAAKHHTIVLGADGEVYTWGHRLVNPRRVLVTRNVKKSGGTPLTFHRMERLHVVSVAAGMVHSMALTDDGTLFYWVSSDPDLKCQQLYSFTGSKVVSISAGKYWGAAVTCTGNIYMWDGTQANDRLPSITRLQGVKKATSVAVGETHLLILSSMYHPAYPFNVVVDPIRQQSKINDHELLEWEEGVIYRDLKSECSSSSTQNNDVQREVPSLKSLCEKVAAESLVEPRNALTMLEISDTLGADGLRRHCEEIVIRNLDYIFMVSPNAVASTSLDILAHLEKLLDAKSSEYWSHRPHPTPTATLPVIIDSEEEDNQCHRVPGNNYTSINGRQIARNYKSRNFLISSGEVNFKINKQVRDLFKKLQQIEVLEAKWSKGHVLDEQQIAKIQTRPVLEGSLVALGVPIESLVVTGSSPSAEVDGKGVKKEGTSRRQRRKGKQKASKPEDISHHHQERKTGQDAAAADMLAIEVSHVSDLKVGAEAEEPTIDHFASQESAIPLSQKSSMRSSNGLNQVSSKKKSRKGGLSMFLSGGLDHPPKIVTPPPPPKKEGPAWGGAKVSNVSSSLRDIQTEQKRTEVHAVAGQVTNHPEDGSNSRKIPLSSYLPSKPIPVVAAVQSSREKSTPLWSGSTTPPAPRPSLRDIQSQQVKRQNFHHSPKTTSGFAVSSGQGSPSDSGDGVNRWYKPEIDSPSSIRSIQIEEKAMKDLRRFYKSVKIVVKDQS